jgi:hypothetical protein
MSGIYVKVYNPESDPRKSKYANINRVQVSVDYSKGKGVVMSLYPAELTDDGIESIIITDGSYTTLENIARLNRKRVDHWRAEIASGIDDPESPAYRLVNAFCNARGLVIDKS